jgi:hydroxymethylglutaryl-CoA reductase
MSTYRHNATRPTWVDVVLRILRNTGEAMTLSNLNSAVEAEAPELVEHNPHHWQAKVRQTVQKLRDRGLAENVAKGVRKAVPSDDTAPSEQPSL